MRTRQPIFAALSAALLLAACGGGGDDSNSPDAGPHPDAAVQPDAGPSCSAITPGALDIANPGDGTFITFQGPFTPDLGDGGTTQYYSLQFYGGIEPDLASTFDLSAGNQADYATCALCVLVVSLNADGSLAHVYYQDGGSMTLTEDPTATGHMIGTATDVSVEEVMIDSSTFHSTPVPGGACFLLGNMTLDHDKVPNAYTCDHATYGDGTTCDCVCGGDPDCANVNAPTNGCTAGTQSCFNDACYDHPLNDTCTTGVPLVVGAAATAGTTLGGLSDYDAGLEGATCTGFAQPGADVTYSVALTAATSYTFTLTNGDTTNLAFDPSLSLVGPGGPDVCSAAPITTCVKGADAGVGGDGETFQFTPTTTGTYYLIVDSYATTEGDFTIAVATP